MPITLDLTICDNCGAVESHSEANLRFITDPNANEAVITELKNSGWEITENSRHAAAISHACDDPRPAMQEHNMRLIAAMGFHMCICPNCLAAAELRETS